MSRKVIVSLAAIAALGSSALIVSTTDADAMRSGTFPRRRRHFGEPCVGEPCLCEPCLGEPGVGEPRADEPCVDEPSFAGPDRCVQPPAVVDRDPAYFRWRIMSAWAILPSRSGPAELSERESAAFHAATGGDNSFAPSFDPAHCDRRHPAKRDAGLDQCARAASLPTSLQADHRRPAVRGSARRIQSADRIGHRVALRALGADHPDAVPAAMHQRRRVLLALRRNLQDVGEFR